MKKCIFLLLCCTPLLLQAQLSINWQKMWGGTNTEFPASFIESTDGGYFIGAYSYSNDINVHGAHGDADMYIIKLNANLDTLWTKAVGGSNADILYSVTATSDGGVIAIGNTLSNDGDAVGNHGSRDCLLAKLDMNGNLEWSKCYGGSAADDGTAVLEMPGGGYLIAAAVASTDGDITINNGLYDTWLARINSTGSIIWSQTYGGSDDEGPRNLIFTPDNNILVVGDKYLPSRSFDIHLMKMDTSGTVLWDSTYGGSSSERTFFKSSIIDEDGNIIVCAHGGSTDGDAPGFYGVYDAVVIKTTADGTLLWGKNFGGSLNDTPISLSEYEDGYLLGINSRSGDFDVSSNYGAEDLWLVQLDTDGNIDWEKNYGGSNFDYRPFVIALENGDILTAASTGSLDFDVDTTLTIESQDIWLLYMCAARESSDSVAIDYGDSLYVAGEWQTVSGTYYDTLTVGSACDSAHITKLTVLPPNSVYHNFSAIEILVWPNPADEILHVKAPATNGTLKLYNAQGQFIEEYKLDKEVELNTNHLSKGPYFIRLEADGEIPIQTRFIKQ